MKSKMVISILMLGLAMLPLQAQEANEAEPEPADQPRAGETPTPTGAPSSPDIFVPSEEISEDFAVPFPVDI